MVYQLVRRCRLHLVEVLRSAFESDQTLFDGREWVTVPETLVVDMEYWDQRQLPVVVTRSAQGRAVDVTMKQVVGHFVDNEGKYGDPGKTYEVLGGTGELSVELLCAAYDQRVQQLITDKATLALLLSRSYIYQTYLMLVGGVQLAEAGRYEAERMQEPVYFSRIVVPITADFRALRPVDTVSAILIE